MMRYFLLTLALLTCGFSTAHAAPQHRPLVTWTLTTEHLDWRTATRVIHTTRQSYPLFKVHKQPIGYRVTTRRISPHVVQIVRYPTFAPRNTFVKPASGYQDTWLVTYYLATGAPMANGIFPSVGWAACGYDVALGTRVSVPRIGTLTCGDRIGFQPWHHIDVFGIPLGTHYATVTVFP